MLLQSTQVLGNSTAMPIVTKPRTPVRSPMSTQVLKDPEEQPLGNGRTRLVVPAAGIASSLSRRAW